VTAGPSTLRDARLGRDAGARAAAAGAVSRLPDGASGEALDRSIAAARDALIGLQSAQGFWLFELEADCTIPAEYIMMMHFLDEIDAVLQEKLAIYLRRHQADHGGWPLFPGGELDLSGTVKVYYALKLAGDEVAAHQ